MLPTIETSILALLSAALPNARVKAITELSDADRMAAPAVLLAFDGLSINATSGARDLAVCDSRWLVVAVARNATRPHEGAQARQDALAMLHTVFSALSGQTPDGAFRALRFEGAESLEYEPPVAFLPMRFSCEVQLRSTTP